MPDETELTAGGLPEDLDDAWRYVWSQADAPSRAWLKATVPTAIHDSTVIITVPNDFTRDRVESRLRPWIEQQLQTYFSKHMRLAITIDAPTEDEDDDEDDIDTFATQRSGSPTPQEPVSNRYNGRLNPKYTFETFVIGSSNRFAHAAAVAVAEQPGKAYNPLMIYGGSGLGKTHLLHALGHYVRNYQHKARVKYVSTEELTNDFINAISENRTAEFRRTYRDIDVLLIDDIQFLESKIQTQEEFFHTFNHLHTLQKQIVMTSDRPPKSLEALEERG
ncbi:MAG: DnaA/Hda family protein, partial [Micropruina sp.]